MKISDLFKKMGVNLDSEVDLSEPESTRSPASEPEGGTGGAGQLDKAAQQPSEGSEESTQAVADTLKAIVARLDKIDPPKPDPDKPVQPTNKSVDRGGPPANTTATAISVDEIPNMSQDQINDNWDKIKVAIQESS